MRSLALGRHSHAARSLRSLPLSLPLRPRSRSAQLARRQSPRETLPSLRRQAERLGHTPSRHGHGLSGLAHNAPHAVNLDLDLALDQHDHGYTVQVRSRVKCFGVALEQRQGLGSNRGFDDRSPDPDRGRRRLEGHPLPVRAPAAGDKAKGPPHQ